MTTSSEADMVSVGVRELKARASEIVREVQRRGTAVEITLRGRPVARLVPVRDPRSSADAGGRWRTLDVIAADIGRKWPAGASATRAVTEGRR